MEINELVSIGITTKNRWHDLENTLRKIQIFNLNKIAILIFDDGSDTPCSIDFSKYSLNIKHRRFEKSQGLITRRNQLVQEIKTKYYLSFDDDSFPAKGSLEKAVEFAESQENLLCLGFPIYNPVIQKYESKSLDSKPYQVRFFIGCGHLLHCENFFKIGGYRDELIHQGEEMDLAARGFQKGLYCYHFPGFQIHHTASNQGRNFFRMDYYGSRNNVLWNDWYLPENLTLVKQTRNLISRILLSLKVKRLGPLQGELAGFQDISKYKDKRKPMSLEIYHQWQKLLEK
ncbi:MAG: glycosyltransferase [Xenococcus sp. MO_188.B8]|nr:glycosyltransferase [Xenococcus sp. MO_188.B8]